MGHWMQNNVGLVLNCILICLQRRPHFVSMSKAVCHIPSVSLSVVLSSMHCTLSLSVNFLVLKARFLSKTTLGVLLRNKSFHLIKIWNIVVALLQWLIPMVKLLLWKNKKKKNQPPIMKVAFSSRSAVSWYVLLREHPLGILQTWNMHKKWSHYHCMNKHPQQRYLHCTLQMSGSVTLHLCLCEETGTMFKKQ